MGDAASTSPTFGVGCPFERCPRVCAVLELDRRGNRNPTEGLLPFRARRPRPYLYSELEVQRLLEEARSMPAQFSLQPLTYHCLFGLLAVTGLRIGEALNLESRDVNWAEGVLTIRTSKFGKSRLV